MGKQTGSSGPIALSREELHKLVWVTPMARLAVQFGLSDNGLAKICRKLDVPYPPRGYWAKLAAGQKVKAAPLPPAKADTPKMARIKRKVSAPREEISPQLQASLQEAIERIGPVKVPARLGALAASR